MSKRTAIEVLREEQQQLDPDGIMVGVSREALDEVMGLVAKLEAKRKALQATCKGLERERLEEEARADKAEARVDELKKYMQYYREGVPYSYAKAEIEAEQHIEKQQARVAELEAELAQAKADYDHLDELYWDKAAEVSDDE